MLQTVKMVLKRNGLGQLGFHIQSEGIVTDVESYGFAWEVGLRKGSRLVEICKVATITLTHDQIVDLLRTSAVVKVVVVPPLEDGTPRYVETFHLCHCCPGMPIFRYFPLFLAQTVLRRSISRFSLFSPISSFWTFCLFLCSFSVRRHAHVDFQLFSQKSSGIPGCLSVLTCALGASYSFAVT